MNINKEFTVFIPMWAIKLSLMTSIGVAIYGLSELIRVIL